VITIDIWSDLACPFCWIGKHRLQAALAELGPDVGPVQVNWRAFQLDPGAGLMPVPLREAYAAKFGGGERTEQLLANVQAQARADGLDMDFSQGQVKVSTLPAHRLLQQARTQGGDVDAVAEALFRAHFAHGQNLADIQVLIAAGAAGGLSAAQVQDWQGSEQGLAELQAELAQGQQAGISSVPTFVINQRWAIAGAQPVAGFVQALRQIAGEPAPPAAESAAAGCGPDGCSL
jgi:predicted DsbA family dithiol-disulfide isomerase